MYAHPSQQARPLAFSLQPVPQWQPCRCKRAVQTLLVPAAIASSVLSHSPQAETRIDRKQRTRFSFARENADLRNFSYRRNCMGVKPAVTSSPVLQPEDTAKCRSSPRRRSDAGGGKDHGACRAAAYGVALSTRSSGSAASLAASTAASASSASPSG